jgi:hypothetical protein
MNSRRRKAAVHKRDIKIFGMKNEHAVAERASYGSPRPAEQDPRYLIGRSAALSSDSRRQPGHDDLLGIRAMVPADRIRLGHFRRKGRSLFPILPFAAR